MPTTDYPNDQMADRTPYDDLLQQDTAQALRTSMASAVDRQPDVEAKLQSLARDYQMPVEAVRLRQPEIERRARLDALDYDTLAREYPKTANTLADPNRAGIAHDDVDNMSLLERGFRQLGGGLVEAGGATVSGFGVNLDILQRNILGAITDMLPTPRGGAMTPEARDSAIGPLLGQDFRMAGGRVKDFARGDVMIPQNQQTFGDKVVAGVGQVGGQIAMAPFVGPAGLYLQGLDVMDEKVGKDDASQGAKDLATVAGAAVTGITEKWALDRLLGPAGDQVKGALRGALTRIGVAGVSEGGQEFTENLLQDILRQQLTNPNATPNVMDSLDEGGVGAAVGVVVRGMVEGALRVRARGARAEQDAQQAEAHAQVLGELATLAEASKVRERDPASFATFMQSLTEDGVPNVYVDAKTLVDSLDINEVAMVLPSVAEQIAQAAATGGDVVIPTAELLTAGPGQAFMQALLDNARTAPDAMSPVEAREYMQTKGDQLNADIQVVLEKQEQDQNWRQMRDELRDEFKAQLDGVKRFTGDVNRQYANLLANFYSVTAAKLGTTPQELATRYGLRVQSRGVEGGQVLDQGGVREWADRETAPPGTWVKADYKLADSQPVYQVRELNPADLYLPELDSEGRLQPEKRKYLDGYVERAKAGETPPSISVIEMEDGRLRVVDGHRRALAAMAAGKKIRALVSPLVQTAQGKQEATVENIGKDLMQSPQQPRLMAVHNLSADNLLFADKMGGLAVPSIGVVGQDFGGVEGFGEITLIGRKDLVDPARERVFSSDAYTARFPKPEWPKAKTKDAQALTDFVRDAAKEFGDPSLKDETFDGMVNKPDAGRVVEKWLASSATKALFLREQGIDVQPVVSARRFQTYLTEQDLVELRPLYDIANEQQNASQYDTPEQQQLKDEIVQRLRAQLEGRDASERTKKVAEENAQRVAQQAVNLLYRDYRTLAEPAPVNTWETSTKLDELIAPRAAEFKQWVESKVLPKFGDPYLKVGGKKAPYTLDNIVKAMTDAKVKGKEKTMTYGAGQVRAASSVEFSDLEQMRAAATTSVVDPQQYEEAKAETEKKLETYRSAVVGFTTVTDWRGAPDTWEAMDASMRALAKWATGKKRDAAAMKAALRAENFDVAKIPAEAIQQGMDAADALLRAPVPYFEAKPQRAVSLGEFAGAVIPADASQEVRDILAKNGVEVAEYAPGSDRTAAVRDFAATLADQGQATLFQEARGSINLPDDLTRSPAIISLFEGADLSTFLHESGHFFLEVQMDLAARIQAQIDAGATVSEGERSIVDDANTLLAWFGVKGSETTSPLTEWFSLDLETKRPYHEQFARGFEAYAFEGNAPSIELQGMFQKFRAWLLAVYKELRALRVELTDDVRGVMDRMLASTQAIQEAEAARRLGPLFKTAEDAGMSLDEFKAYHALATDASQAAIEELQARGLRDMKWLQGAKDRKLKEMQKLHDSLRREVRAEVRREVMSQPVYRAWQFLTGKGAADETAQPADKPKASKDLDVINDDLLTAVAKLGGLRKDQAVSQWGVDPKQKVESGVFGTPVMRANGGLDLDTMGERLVEAGYLTPDENGKHDPREFEEKFDAAIRGESIYSAWHEYQRPDDEAPVQKLPEGIAFGKLDTAEMQRRYGAQPDAPWRKLQAARMTSTSRGLHPDVVAEATGFESGDQMVKALLDAEAPQSVIEGMTDQRMLERFGDLGTPQGLQRAVDRAIHNEVRARFLSTEIAALERGMRVRQETGQTGNRGQRVTVDIMTQVAKQQAARIVGGTKVKNLRPSQYTTAEARAAKAAERALLAGKAEDALAEKRHQLINLQAAREATRAQEEVEKITSYLRRFNDKPKGLDADYYDQIAQLLERFDLSRGTTLKALAKRKSLQAWVESQREQGFEPEIPPELLDAATRTSYKEMTVDELRGLRDTVRQIEKLGRVKNTLLTAKQLRDFQAVRDLIADSILANAGGRVADNLEPSTRRERWFRAVKDFGAAHIKAATWARVFDGGKDGGPVWEYFIRPANEAADMETRMRAEATAKLHEILAPVIKRGRMDGKGTHFPSIGRAMNREQVFAMALNMGNEGNIQRMLDGEGWTPQQIQPVVATLSAADWQAVQAVWDHFEGYRPLIGAKERRVYGKEPAWVDPMPLTVVTSDGQTVQLRGGYYPVKYNPERSHKAEQHTNAEDAKRQMQAAYTSATTRRGFTKSRAEAVKDRPLLYSLAGIYSNTNDVIHDLAWHEFLIDATKLLRSDKIADAIRDTYGPGVFRQFTDGREGKAGWLETVARGEQGLQAELDSMLGRLRQGVSIAGLGFNVMSAAIQPIGLTQSVVRVGGKWIGRGVAQYLSNPLGKAREVNARSEFMAARARTRFRELNELRNQVEGEHPVRTWLSNGAFYFMTRMQMVVDVPTWLGAYEKAISEGNTDERAGQLADQAVIDAQGGGQMKDLSAIERGGPAQKLFTVFYSFMNTALNVGVAQTMTEKSKAKLAADYLLLYSVPAVLTVALKDALTPGDSGDWDDLEKLLRKLLEAQLDNLFGLMVGVRELAGAAKMATGLAEYSRDYQGPAGLRLLSDITGLSEQIGQGELDDTFRKRAINVLGSAFGLPAAQANRTITGTQALLEGDTMNPAAVAFGYQEP